MFAGRDLGRLAAEQRLRDVPAVRRADGLERADAEALGDERGGIRVLPRQHPHDGEAARRGQDAGRAGVGLGAPQRLHHHVDRFERRFSGVGVQRQLPDADDDGRARIECHAPY